MEAQITAIKASPSGKSPKLDELLEKLKYNQKQWAEYDKKCAGYVDRRLKVAKQQELKG